MHSLNTVLRFGKYRGLTVASVLKFNPRYFAWAVKNIDGFDLDAEARKIGQRAINAEREFSANQQNAWAWGFGLEAKRGRERHELRMIQIERQERAIADTHAKRGDDFSAPSVMSGGGAEGNRPTLPTIHRNTQ